MRLGALLVASLVGCAASSPAPDAAAPDGPDEPDEPILPGSNLHFRNHTANMTAPETSMFGWCPGERTDDGMGHPFIDFQPGDTQVGVNRAFSIWQFETEAPAGTRLRVEDGFDELASRGVSVRYLELEGAQNRIWRADRGTVTLVATGNAGYSLALAGVHLVPAADPAGANRAVGDLEVDGTITAVLP